jgi:two-component system phosphate regulon sensor histidine kinase PhoR
MPQRQSDWPKSSPLRVWVVDDSALDARNAEAILADRFAVEIFTDGSAVLERILAAPPDALVLDWVMPGISGIEVVQFLRSEGSSLQQLPVLLLTSQDQPEQIAHGLSAGANDYLSKPYAAQELGARVDSLLRSSRLSERLLATERTISAFLANAPDAVIGVDADGVIVYANAEAHRALPDEMVLGRRLSMILPGLRLVDAVRSPGDSLLPLPDVVAGGRTFSVSARVLASDPERKTTILLRDVTERRRADDGRLNFHSIIAHDLRSPLQAMIARAALLAEGSRGPLPAEAVLELRKLEGSMRGMAGIIEDFLQLAPAAGTTEKRSAVEMDLSLVIERAVEELLPSAQAGELSLAWARPAQPVVVLGDEARLAQVVSNLVGNAIKFTPPGGRITARVTELDGWVETEVIDTGTGVRPNRISNLFERITPDPAEATTNGAGLGLAIVKEIVESHHGRVGVRETPGGGSTFWFQLPSAASR